MGLGYHDFMTDTHSIFFALLGFIWTYHIVAVALAFVLSIQHTHYIVIILYVSRTVAVVFTIHTMNQSLPDHEDDWDISAL